MKAGHDSAAGVRIHHGANVGRLWPFGQDRWDAYAKELNARVALLQVHVEPSWLYVVCSRCGWDLEQSPSEVAAFRHAVASHHCPAQLPVVPELASVPVPTAQMELF